MEVPALRAKGEAVAGTPAAAGLEVLVESVTVAYGRQTVLDGFSMAVARGESVALMGPSGSGKTSLLACVSGIRLPDAGGVQVGCYPLAELHASDRAALRRAEMGLVFQTPDLLPELTVGENVAITRIFDGQDRKSAVAAAARCLVDVGLAGVEHRRTDELSGGEAQRVALARAMCRDEVGLVVADEPTASLDRANADLMAGLLIERARSRGVTVLLATHDPLVAARCDRVLELEFAGTERRGG